MKAFFKKTTLLFFSTITLAVAQEIAIIDQGRNTTMTNRGAFYNPSCISHQEIWFSGNGYVGSNPDVLKGNHVGISSVDLCKNSHFSDEENGAFVPRTRSLPALNDLNAPYQRVTMVLNGIIPFYDFQAPYQNMVFGSNLKHGTHVANAAYEFDNSVKRKMVQVFRIDDRKVDPKNCDINAPRTINPSSATIGHVGKVVEALQEIAQDPDGVDAINMSIAFRSSYCQRQQNEFIPDACTFKDGQDEVNELSRLGIPFVVGLLNEDIDSREETWPACLDGVITVGSENDNENLQNGGIGVGGDMSIDFFAKNTVTDNGGAAGNSMAAPRIATAFALLKTAVPQSTIGERIEALNKASSLKNTYRVHGTNYTARYVKPDQIPNAIIELEKIIVGNIDGIGHIDNAEYGSIYGDSSSDYSFEIDFDHLIAVDSKASPATAFGEAGESTVSSIRDVVLSFDAKMSNDSFKANGFEIFINGSKQEATTLFINNETFTYTLERTLFASGKNTIRIAPRYYDRPWGLTNIEAEFTPVVALSLNQLDGNEYGSEGDPERPTGLRATFEVPDTNEDVLFYVTGWGLRSSDEVKLYLNGNEYGFLTKGSSYSDLYSPQDTFRFAKADLASGSNVIEFVQKEGATTWGVKNMFVTLDTPVPTLPLGIRSTVQYGNNYGTNEHPVRLDVTFTPLSQHDHNISWNGYDIDRGNGSGTNDVSLYLNDVFIKQLNSTSNNRLGSTESFTLAARLFRSGSNTLSFRVNGFARDATWGVTNLLVRASTILDLDDENTLEKDYGYYTKYRGLVPTGWTRQYSTQEHQTRLYATFESSASQDKLIPITGWDIDSPDELGVYINGTFLKYVNSASSSSVYSTPELLRIPKANLLSGINTISFRTDVVSGFNNEKWGVFFGQGRNMSVAPIMLLLLDE